MAYRKGRCLNNARIHQLVDKFYACAKSKAISPTFNHINTQLMNQIGADGPSRSVYDKNVLKLTPFGVNKVRALTNLEIDLDLFSDPDSNVFGVYYCSLHALDDDIDKLNLKHDAFSHLQRFALRGVTWIFPEACMVRHTVKALAKARLEPNAEILLVVPAFEVASVIQDLPRLVGKSPKTWVLSKAGRANVLSKKPIFPYHIVHLSNI